jgi:AAA15 family ATPase/GTPase
VEEANTKKLVLISVMKVKYNVHVKSSVTYNYNLTLVQEIADKCIRVFLFQESWDFRMFMKLCSSLHSLRKIHDVSVFDSADLFI